MNKTHNLPTPTFFGTPSCPHCNQDLQDYKIKWTGWEATCDCGEKFLVTLNVEVTFCSKAIDNENTQYPKRRKQ